MICCKCGKEVDGMGMDVVTGDIVEHWCEDCYTLAIISGAFNGGNK